MLMIFLAVCVILSAVSALLLRRRGTGPRWPFLTSSVLTGLVAAVGVGAVVLAATVGRTTWNSWVAGTPHRESVTLGVLLVGFPLLFVLALVTLVAGILGGRRHRRAGGGAGL